MDFQGKDMKNSIEPGLMQVFRWFAGLRILLMVFAIGGQSLIPIGIDRFRLDENTLPSLIIVIVWMLILLVYLNWKPAQEKLGRVYLPLGLLIATASLLLEPFVLSPITRFWQPDAFLFILLILIAWQYDLRIVVLFVIGVAGFEAMLHEILPRSNSFLSGARGFPLSENAIVYGRLLARSSSSIVLGLVINRLVRSQREQRVALEEANRQLVRHSSTLEQLATSRERNRLSRELHDTVAHTLSGLTVQLEALNTAWKNIPSKAQEMVDKMLQGTRDGLNESRRTLKNLRAAPLEEMGLALAVRALAEDFAKRNNWKADLDIQADLDDTNPEIEQAFYRVAQEALENIARHANAKQVKLQLRKEKRGLHLKVEDDGGGFEADSVDQKERLGLQLLKERAELIEAKLEVNSQMGKGTTINLLYEAG